MVVVARCPLPAACCYCYCYRYRCCVLHVAEVRSSLTTDKLVKPVLFLLRYFLTWNRNHRRQLARKSQHIKASFFFCFRYVSRNDKRVATTAGKPSPDFLPSLFFLDLKNKTAPKASDRTRLNSFGYLGRPAGRGNNKHTTHFPIRINVYALTEQVRIEKFLLMHSTGTKQFDTEL